jgi:hypothetical protein
MIVIDLLINFQRRRLINHSHNVQASRALPTKPVATKEVLIAKSHERRAASCNEYYLGGVLNEKDGPPDEIPYLAQLISARTDYFGRIERICFD